MAKGRVFFRGLPGFDALTQQLRGSIEAVPGDGLSYLLRFPGFGENGGWI